MGSKTATPSVADLQEHPVNGSEHIIDDQDGKITAILGNMLVHWEEFADTLGSGGHV